VIIEITPGITDLLRAIENQVRFRFDVLVLPFCEVLMMLISFALPFSNDKCTEYVLDASQKPPSQRHHR